MGKLYIIGNGFDLYNGLKTRYSDFNNYVSANDKDLEWELSTYFNFKVDSMYLWKDFENDLSSYNYAELFSNYNNIDIHAESFKPSEAFGLEDEIHQVTEELVGNIKDTLTDWIFSIEIPEEPTVSIKMDKNADYINFNYTDTLQNLFDIPRERILFIHNNAMDQFGELVIGHAQREEANPSIPELDENGDSNRTIFTDSENAARSPFYALIKNTDEIIQENPLYFQSLQQKTQIIVLGHSLGEADWPYFEYIKTLFPDAEWKISYYVQQEYDSFRSILLNKIGIAPNKLQISKIEELI